MQIALLDLANQFQMTIVREVNSWAFAGVLAASIGHGRLVIDIKERKVDRAYLEWGMKTSDAPPKTK